MSEEDIVRRAQQGDRQAWGELYEAYVERVFRFISSRVEGTMEAEDITEQAFLNAFQALPTYKWRGITFSAWLFRIARNLVIDASRKRAAQRRFIGRQEMPPAINPEEEAEIRLRVEEVRAALGKLPPAQQEVIHLRFIAELSLEETAQVMGKSVGMVKALQHSAIRSLREQFKEDG